VADLLNLIYPVGIIVDFGTEGKDFNPNTTWAPQKWKKVEDGRVTIASNTTYPIGTTGGEAAHYLTGNEMPPHGHSAGKVYNYKLSNTGIAKSAIDKYGEQFLHIDQTSSAASDIFHANAEGGGASHNNMQPYMAVNRWMRIS
jgi:microcystin-dependent protein